MGFFLRIIHGDFMREFSAEHSKLFQDKPKKIIAFCDPGLDDAFMLAQIASSDKMQLLGIVPGVGNVSLDKTINNTLRILELTGRWITVDSVVEGIERGKLLEVANSGNVFVLSMPSERIPNFFETFNKDMTAFSAEKNLPALDMPDVIIANA